MSTPIIEYITIDIETAINAITTANGFNQDLTAIRPKRNDFKDIIPKDLTVLIKQADEEEAESEIINIKKWLQPFVIMAIVIDSDDATASIDTRINQVRADIQKKLMEDYTRGGYATDTIILPSAEFEGEKGFTGIAVNIAVKYRVNFDDPYTKA